MPAAKGAKSAGAKKAKASKKTFVIDCSQPVEADIYDIAAFENFLKDRIKVNGKTGKMGEDITVTREGANITVVAKIAFSKRYLKYLTKKFLKAQNLRDHIRVIARTKNGYFLRFFNLYNDQEDADEDAE